MHALERRLNLLALQIAPPNLHVVHTIYGCEPDLTGYDVRDGDLVVVLVRFGEYEGCPSELNPDPVRGCQIPSL
jgi:hypothetical protein